MAEEPDSHPTGKHRDAHSDKPHGPVPRSRSGMVGRHWPRSGTEPITARSALGVRLVLSLVFTPLFLAAAAVFAGWASVTGERESPSRDSLWSLTQICLVLFLLAAVDLFVVLRRRRRERGSPR